MLFLCIILSQASRMVLWPPLAFPCHQPWTSHLPHLLLDSLPSLAPTSVTKGVGLSAKDGAHTPWHLILDEVSDAQ